jgi:hypothetical protein
MSINESGGSMSIVDASFMRSSIQLTPGRVLWVCRAIAKRLTPAEAKVFASAIKDAEAAAEEAIVLLAVRRRAKARLFGETARARDRALDAVLSAVHGQLAGLARVFEAESATGARVRRLLDALFPAGLDAVTNAAYADELGEVERLLTLSENAEQQAEVTAVPGLAEMLEVLKSRAAELEAAVEREPTTAPTYAEARDAVARADRRMSELAMAILVHHRGDADASSARRATLLEPLLVQQESKRQRFRRRLPVEDVDPSTGELSAKEASAEPVSAVENGSQAA